MNKPRIIDKDKKASYDRNRYAAKKAALEALTGQKKSVVAHGMTRTPEYRSWQAMRSRCLNPADKDYPWYGGRGIFVCDAWRDSFVSFFTDMGARPPGTTIERGDNNGPYCKANCTWATRQQQTRNRRIAINVEFEGKTYPLIELCQAHAIPYSTLHSRLFKHGWALAEALSKRRFERREITA